MSWVSDRIGINWDVAKATENLSMAPIDFIRGVASGQRLDDATKEFFNKTIGGIRETNIMGLYTSITSSQGVRDFVKANPKLNDMLFDLPSEISEHGSWSKDQLYNQASSPERLNQVAQLGVKAGAIVGGIYAYGALPAATKATISGTTLKEAGTYYGLGSALAKGDLRGAAGYWNQVPGIDVLPDLPDIPPEFADPIRDGILNPGNGGPRISDPWQSPSQNAPYYNIQMPASGNQTAMLAIGAVLIAAYFLARSKK